MNTGWQFLFAGLIGALASAFVHWWRQRQRIRAELTMELAAWMDKVFRELTIFIVQFPNVSPEQVFLYSYGAFPQGINVKIREVYGEGWELKKFNEIVDVISTIAGEEVKLFENVGRNPGEWQEVRTQFLILFKKAFVPLQKEFENALIKKNKYHWWFLGGGLSAISGLSSDSPQGPTNQ